MASAHLKKSGEIVLLAVFLSMPSLQAALGQPAFAATDPPTSATVLAGCTYFSSLKFTNNVAQYVTANPQYRSLNFTQSTCINGGVGGFAVPPPKLIPPLFFTRGTTVMIRTV